MIERRATQAGAIAGAAAAAVFLLVHAAWIVPIWQVAPFALTIGAGTGAAIGSIPKSAAAGRRTWPVSAAIRFGGCWLVLGPSIGLAELGLHAGSAPLPAVVLGLFGPTMALAALAAVFATRSWRTAPTGALAGALLAVGPGHNIPLLAATPAVPMELAVLALVFATGSLVFVAAERRLPLAAPQSAGALTR